MEDKFFIFQIIGRIEENGVASIDTIATQTGIAQKNVSRFLAYQGIENANEIKTQNLNNTGVVLI